MIVRHWCLLVHKHDYYVVIYDPDLKLAALQIFRHPPSPLVRLFWHLYLSCYLCSRKSFSSVSSNFYGTSQSYSSLSTVGIRISFQIRRKSSVYFYIILSENNSTTLGVSFPEPRRNGRSVKRQSNNTDLLNRKQQSLETRQQTTFLTIFTISVFGVRDIGLLMSRGVY